MKKIATHRGFTMLEVLIAVVVLSIGMLGIASLQAFGQRSNHSGYYRSLATALAYDMIDRMRANKAGVANGSYNVVDTTVNTYTDQGCASGTVCTPATLALYDMYDWQQELKTQLPTGNGKVSGLGTGSTFTITVMWDDNRNGSSSKVCGIGALTCFTVSTEL